MSRLGLKFLAIVLGLLVPSLALFGLLAGNQAQRSLEAELGLRLESIAATIAADLSAGGDAGRLARMQPDSFAVRERLASRMEALREGTGAERIRILNPALSGLVDTDEVEPFATYFDLETDSAELDALTASGEPTSGVLFFDDDGTPYKRGYAAVWHDDAIVAIVAVEASSDHLTVLRSQRRSMLWIGLAIVLLFAATTVLIAGRVVGPIQTLAAATARIAEGDLQSPVPVQGKDEVADLARRFERMREALLARDEEMQLMLGGIAHEIRNPLAGMELFIGILEEDLAEDPTTRGYASRVRRELDYLKRVVNTFLSFARQPTLEVSRFSAEAVLSEVISSVSGIAGEEGVELELAIDPTDVELSGDFSSLRGALLNVVQNAVQACAFGERVQVSVSANERERRIVIEDTGKGMDDETVANIFRPFFTTKEKGTGLGLPLVRKLVVLHGGEISLTSTEKVGTTFVITLPSDPTAPAYAAADASSASDAFTPAEDDYDGEMIG